MRVQHKTSSDIRLWPLALLAAVLPVIGAVIAWQLATAHALIPSCNPLWDGCTSISRAGRYGLANLTFRGTMIPAAVLQGVLWYVCARWLSSFSESRARSTWIAVLGGLAALFLILYASFLGIDGRAYRWLRQYGTLGYFAFSYLCVLLTAAAPPLRARQHDLPKHLPLIMLILMAAVLLLGLMNAVLTTFFDAAVKDRIENITEWWAALALSSLIASLSVVWRALDVRLKIQSD